MKRGFIFGLVLIFLATGVFGLSVELVSPVNNAVYVDSNTVVFKCKATGEDLRFLELYTNINGWGKKAEASNPASNTEVTFSIKNITNGDFLWNCKVIDGVEGIKFSSNNRSFSVNLAPNSAPVYKGGLGPQSWNMNSERRNAFDLDDYFSDADGNKLTYSVTGNDNINVNMDAGNVVSFSPPSNWFGTERIYFTANDGKDSVNSDVINLTVIKTTTPPSTGGQPGNTNTAPTIEGKIPDQNMSSENSWYLDLGNYGKDNEDSSSKLNWAVEGVSNDVVKVDIDNTLKRTRFNPQGIGTDTITFIVTDSGGLNASQSVKVSVYGKQIQKNEIEELLKEVEQPDSGFVITSVSPSEKNVIIDENEIKVFKIETSRGGDVEWYLDGELLGETKEYFSFNSNQVGNYNLTVYVSDLDRILSNSWKIMVKKKEITSVEVTNVQEQLPICGNNLIDVNETCSSCPSDVVCKEREICENDVCAEKKGLLSITGSVVGNLSDDVKNIGYGILGVLGVSIISVLVIRRKNRLKYSRVGRLELDEEKEGLIKKLQRRLREYDQKRKERKEQKKSLKNQEFKVKQDIVQIAPSSLSLITFIKDSVVQGHSKRDIKKALKEKGWGRLQIWKAFRKI